MTVFQEIKTGTPSGVKIAEKVEDISVIKSADCCAAVCHRPVDQAVLDWLAELQPEQLPKARIVLHPSRVRKNLDRVFNDARTPQCRERDWLINDVTELADKFAQVMKAPYLRLRFDVITTNACRRFHIDAVHARLVCTYRGTGTQYGISTDEADPANIFTVPTGSPILLRGTLWPETPKSGLLHRSPPIEGTGESRLVLVLDPVFDVEDAT